MVERFNTICTATDEASKASEGSNPSGKNTSKEIKVKRTKERKNT